MNIAISEFLRNMVQNEGPDYLLEESRVCACLADIFPKSKRERSILRMSIKMGYPSKLEQSLKDISFDNKKVVIHKLAQEFCDEGWITREAALYALNILAYAKGYLPEFTEPEETTSEFLLEKVQTLEKERALLQRQNAVLKEKLKNSAYFQSDDSITDSWQSFISNEDLELIKVFSKNNPELMAKCGKILITSKDSKTASFGEELLFSVAEKDYAEAQMLLGEIYYRNKDEGRAYYWLQRSANNGNVTAAYKLGIMCGMSGRYKDAVKWFKIAADGGVVEAQLQYGIMLQFGIGVSQDLQLALYWFQKSANLGNEVAFEKYQKLLEIISK